MASGTFHPPAADRHGLVGRDRELAVLHAALADAQVGRGGLVLVCGEPGIGKTGLAAAAAAAARDRGVLVLWGSAWEDGGAPAYWPWVQVLRAYRRQVGPAAMGATAGPDLARLTQLAPELADLAPMPSPACQAAASMAGESVRFALFDALAGFLLRAAEATPLLIVLDDLHAAGAPAALLVQFLATEVRRAPILVLITYRQVETHLDPGVAAVLGALDSQATTLSLTGLADTEVAELIRSSTGTAPDPDLTAAVARRTEGNPLFVREIARLLGPSHRVETAGEQWPVPAGIRQAIRARFARLTAAAHDADRVFAAAAILGREFDLADVGELVGLAAPALLDLLGHAVAAELLQSVPGALGRYRFSHALVRETLSGDLRPAARAEWHAAAGAVLERRPDADPARLAHHFLGALPLVDADRAAEHAARAGDAAMRALAYEEAAGHYRDALDALDHQAPADRHRRCELLLALGSALTRGGDPPQARTVLHRAAELARRLDHPESLARAALIAAERLDFNAVEERTVALLGEAAEAVRGSGSALEARVLARLAVAGYHAGHGRRDALSARAVQIARRTGDPATVTSAVSARLHAMWGRQHPREVLPAATEIIELAEQSGDADRAFDGHMWRLTALVELGELTAAERDVYAVGQLADEL
ncbi:MAG TPA: AAA family ATPase, partial [Actinomycetes bacterium]|nr:AAA family ATPase [Actinomycetes bacterium]